MSAHKTALPQVIKLRYRKPVGKQALLDCLKAASRHHHV